MKNIESALEKIKNILDDPREKTNIDLDLLMDYTREMYEDIMIWKKNIAHGPVVEENENVIEEEKQNVEKEVIHEKVEDPLIDEIENDLQEEENNSFSEQNSESLENLKLEEEPQTQEQKTSFKEEQSYSGKGKIFATELFSFQIEQDKPAENQIETIGDSEIELEQASLGNEDKPMEITNHQESPEMLRPSIIFEPPKSIKKDSSIASEHKLQEDFIPLKKTKSEFQDVSQIFENNKHNYDIRKLIGLNDRYLFSNELFHSKAEYEESLNKINEFESYVQAEQYIKGQIANKNKWDDSETVESFYELLKMFFKSK